MRQKTGKWLLAAITIILISALMAPGAALAADKQIGVMWMGESGVAKDVTRGLLQGMKSKAPAIDMEFKIELPGEDAAGPIYLKWQKEKDAIVFLRSSGARYMGKNHPRIPGFIGGCSHPTLLGAVYNLEAPEGMITGVTYYLDAARKVAVFKRLFPEMKRLGLIVQGSHPSSPIDRSETRAACEAMGIDYREALCETETDVLIQGKAMAGDVDLLVMGSQAVVNSAIPRLAGLVDTPIATYLDRSVEGLGAVCALAADNEKLGGMLADSIISVLIDGKPVSDVPVKRDPDPVFLLNMTMVKKLGIAVPDDVAAMAKKVH